ncbi:hypothetical protein FBEOM_7395 [Fusarium beomiforme]|uniref:Uncharacterized protein n=1 Tax=Fusarium beomiforme TaxID=44412 RepID=A0A9P5AHQ3_9HYPO|nr:hypothetical protein FBEOM_7395 [Fusarium beomiforme]
MDSLEEENRVASEDDAEVALDSSDDSSDNSSESSQAQEDPEPDRPEGLEPRILRLCGLYKLPFKEGVAVVVVNPANLTLPRTWTGSYSPAVIEKDLQRAERGFHEACVNIVGNELFADGFVDSCTWNPQQFGNVSIEPPPSFVIVRTRWLRSTLATLLRYSVNNRLPLEVCENIASCCLSEFATKLHLDAWLQRDPGGPKRVTLPVHRGQTIWAQYIEIEGLHYIKSLSDIRVNEDDTKVFEHHPGVYQRLYFAENSLGVRKLIVAENGEIPCISETRLEPGLRWVATPKEFPPFYIKMRFDVSPSLPYDRIFTDGPVLASQGLKLLDVNERVSELWLRKGLFAHSENNRTLSKSLIIATNNGRRFVLGPHFQCRDSYNVFSYQAIAKFPSTTPSQMFYQKSKFYSSWLGLENTATWDQCKVQLSFPQPSISNRYFWYDIFLSIFTELTGVRTITPCRGWEQDVRDAIAGLLFTYADGRKRSVGQIRLDHLEDPVTVVSERFWLGSSTKNGQPRREDLWPPSGKIIWVGVYEPTSSAEMQYLEIPLGGQLQWRLSLGVYPSSDLVRHLEVGELKDEMDDVLAREATSGKTASEIPQSWPPRLEDDVESVAPSKHEADLDSDSLDGSDFFGPDSYSDLDSDDCVTYLTAPYPLCGLCRFNFEAGEDFIATGGREEFIEPPKSFTKRRKLWYQQAIATDLRRGVQGRIPEDICQYIASFCNQERACQAIQELWLDPTRHKKYLDYVDIGKNQSIWAQHVEVEGLRYVKSLSTRRLSKHDTLLLRAQPRGKPPRMKSKARSIKAEPSVNIYFSEDHLGIRDVVITRDELPPLDMDLPWVIHRHKKGIKLRYLTVHDRNGSLLPERSWAVLPEYFDTFPEIPPVIPHTYKRLYYESVGAVNWNSQDVYGYSFYVDNHNIRDNVWFYLPVDHDEMVSDLWLRKGFHAYFGLEESEALIVRAIKGRSLKLGHDSACSSLVDGTRRFKYKAIAILPLEGPSHPPLQVSSDRFWLASCEEKFHGPSECFPLTKDKSDIYVSKPLPSTGVEYLEVPLTGRLKWALTICRSAVNHFEEDELRDKINDAMADRKSVSEYADPEIKTFSVREDIEVWGEEKVWDEFPMFGSKTREQLDIEQDGRWWTVFSQHQTPFFLKGKFDGIKLHDLSLYEYEDYHLGWPEDTRWAVPPTTLDHIPEPPIPCSNMWFDDERIFELYVRRYGVALPNDAHPAPAATLIVSIDLKYQQPEGYSTHAKYDLVRTMPQTYPCRMFFASWNSSGCWMRFEGASIFPTLSLDSSLNKALELLPVNCKYHYSSAELEGVRTITSCQSWKDDDDRPDAILGLLFTYADGRQRCVGQVRVDFLGEPIYVTSENLWIGYRETEELSWCTSNQKDASGVDFISFDRPERDEWEVPYIKIPMRGRLDWYFSQNQCHLSHEGDCELRDEFLEVLAQDDTPGIPRPGHVVKPFSFCIGRHKGFDFQYGEEIMSYQENKEPMKDIYRFQQTIGIPYHPECIERTCRTVIFDTHLCYSVAAATYLGNRDEVPKSLGRRCRRWLVDNFAQNLLQILHGRLPQEVCRNIASNFPREQAVRLFQQLWSTSDRPRPGNISIPIKSKTKLWAQYIKYEGIRCVRSFSYDSRGGDEEFVLESDAKKPLNIFIRHNGLGVNKIIATEGDERPRREEVEGH